MKAFNAWRDADRGSKTSSDAISELQQVILKKDLMIVSLQLQLETYTARFGALPPEDLDKLAQSDAMNELPVKQNRKLSAEITECAADNITQLPKSIGYDLKSVQDSKQSPPRVIATSPRLRAASDVDETRVCTRCSKNVVLDFVEDSPMFRRQLESFEESVTGLCALLKEIVSHSKEYAAAGKHFGEVETALADELIQRKHARAIFSTSCSELGSLSDLFGEMHDTLEQLQSSRVSMLLGVESLLSRSIQQFAEKELLKEAGELKKDVTRLGDEYEALLGKLLSKSRQPGQQANGTGTPTSGSDASLGSPAQFIGGYNGNVESMITGTPSASATFGGGSSSNILGLDSGLASDKQQRALEREVLIARRRFELARFDLVRYMNRIDSMKKYVLVECFNSIMYAQLGHFHACHELVKSIEPSLRKRQEMLQVSRKDFEEDEIMWQSQRKYLDNFLLQDIELVSSSYRPGEPSTVAPTSLNVDTNGLLELFPSLDVPIEVISTDTLSSRQTVATPRGGIVKQGFLFVRNSMFPARSWKRRWFEIHTGKLFQTTTRGSIGKHPTEGSLTLVCDLLLARVRELEGSSLPFCFEVIDANRAKLILQATSTRDMNEWIEAARRSTESALEKQCHRKEVHPEQQSVIDELIEANPCCADCGQEPAEWVSINIGCLLCIECSGIHRSLGVHESKVRSLTLDSWDMSLLVLLRDELGNDVVNAVWEYTIPNGWAKSTPSTSREVKARFIQAKYHFHAFAEPDATLEDDDHVCKQELAKRFIAGASRGDVKELMWCVAHGIDVNVRVGEMEETALHVSAASGSATCCDYLVLNGSNLTLIDKRGWSPYDAAKAGGFESIKVALMQKMSLEQNQT
ncbi:arf-gap with coiled-ank repeat and ph domain-containing protein 2-like isoform x1 [Plasmopara halstedii]|uniref:Arf-gap with coiled-ank repeat and ph domain-containing protein 2-like isoform x1 n=1 Tax=Plasmopara halstedii TaxID=4781 RepID=A0A0P1ANE9_PLAHL|nr:arf-gap with coiled-ank repeat and ph domain-containing protein 2-like isoform x1 [Plasmopara halstedii]CEG42948.1 arf-gap with coiled-ank repeat and ph domain-containing protein 2-like isoform x1 [Plasmopara halstedii]|eukprot:XP_024579317.1 arf-gap with coiled-ank repeat and ph domain-containing protein 2-like isoform x1 [Plasmopara halstedii]